MTIIHKITPHLWFDTQARAAAEFYTSVFKESAIKSTTTLYDTPSGSVDVVTIDLWGHEFMLISAGPLFKFNPAVSFLVACATRKEVDELWKKLSAQGTVLMELDAYQFSERYGWVEDSYGLSWQVMFMGDRPIRQTITPVLMFTGKFCGKAEEAIEFYTRVFRDTRRGEIVLYGKAEEPDLPGTVKYADFVLENLWFAAMESAQAHGFGFNEAVSFMVKCDTQNEIDYYWEKLSAVPEAEQCGWLKDKYGVSWQIVPAVMDEMLSNPDRARIDRVTQAFLKMKKFDLAQLKKAYEGRT